MQDALQLRENAQYQLEQIKDLESGIDYLNKVKAIETWAKAEKKDAQLQNMIAEQKIRTQRILGNLIKEGQRSGEIAGPGGDSNMVERDNRKYLSDFDISPNQSSNFQKIASLPTDVFEQEISIAKAETEKRIELTTSRMLNAAKEFEQQKKKEDADITERDRKLIESLKRGETVVVNQKTDLATIRYAESKGIYVRADRFSEWGNPFEMDKDGSRDEVVNNYDIHYLRYKPSLTSKLNNLKGKALGCWCAPLRCHCDVLKANAE